MTGQISNMQLQQAQHKCTDIMLLSDSPNREGNYDTILESCKNSVKREKKKVKKKKTGKKAIKHCLNGTNETHNKISNAS